MITFRTFTTADIPAGLSLCRIAGWNQIENDWKTFLKADAASSSVAIDQYGGIAGTVGTIRYSSFSWIGMLLVHPDFRRRGIGSALLQEAMRIIGTNTTSRLDATPAGREVYLKLGFLDQYSLARMVRDNPAVEKKFLTVTNIRKLTSNDLNTIKDWDERVFGANRNFLLSSILSSETSSAWIYEKDNSIRGYAFCRAGHDFSYAGPLVADDIEVAILLLTKILDQTKGKKLAIDIPESSAKWRTYLESIGFVQQRRFIRMYQGNHPGDGVLTDTYAIGGPEYG
ncbi:MAG: GNAT family N-acetyltransferase [Chryseolinea sp.]